MANSDVSIRTALESVAAGMRLMGLDLGTKTIGVATSDRTRQIATPVETVERKKFTADAARLLELAARENIGLFVLGLPVNMDGSEGPRAQSTRAFARNLVRLTSAIAFAALVISGSLLLLTPMGGWHHSLGEAMIVSGIAGMIVAAIGAMRRDHGRH